MPPEAQIYCVGGAVRDKLLGLPVQDHDWVQGQVMGSGGGVCYVETCSLCGARRHVDTWAQNPETGEQGLTSISYVEE